MARMAAAVYGLDDRLDFVSGHELDEASAQPIPAEMLGRHPSTANTNSSTPPQKRRQTLREVARGFGRGTASFLWEKCPRVSCGFEIQESGLNVRSDSHPE